MRTVKVVSKIIVYEVDGDDGRTLKERPEFRVSSHWHINRMVVLEGPDGSKITVLAKDLEIAIANATRE